MIQRVQSLYFLIVTVLMTLTMSLNLAEIPLADETIILKAFKLKAITADGVESVIAGTPLMGSLILICTIVSFFTIFLYRKRMLQVRLCFALVVMLLGAQGFIVYYITKMNTDMSLISYKIADVFPIISAILIYLAFRGVIRDEMLLRSLNRIR
ncbi:MAG: DUF4293 domain-containing protein [Rikenellaceae bacterium]